MLPAMPRRFPALALWTIGICQLVYLIGDALTCNTLGYDFTGFYAAGQLVLRGQAAQVFDAVALFAAEQAANNVESVLPWAYPPVSFLLVSPLALLPYKVALIVWMAINTIPVIALVTRFSGMRWHVAAAIPIIMHAAFCGQNGGITGALLVGGVMLLDGPRPWLAGVVFGLACFKPQVCLLLPVCLLAAGRRDALAAMAATVLGMAGLSLALFGTEPWLAFLHHLTAHLGYVDDGFLPRARFPTIYAAVYTLTHDAIAAKLAQAASSVCAFLAVWEVWGRSEDRFSRVLVLATVMPLASPFMLEYDLVLTAAPAALLLQRIMTGRATRQDRYGVQFLWFLPIVAGGVSVDTLPLASMEALVMALYALRATRAGLSLHSFSPGEYLSRRVEECPD